jgi:membrane protease subunit HflK
VISAAEGYAMERINRAQGDANRFKNIYREYARAPLVTRKRLYLETINQILPKISKKIIFDENQKNILPLLNLGVEVKK